MQKLLYQLINLVLFTLFFSTSSKEVVRKSEITVDLGNIFSSVTADSNSRGLKSVFFGKNLLAQVERGKTVSSIEHLAFIPLKNILADGTFSESKTEEVYLGKSIG